MTAGAVGGADGMAGAPAAGATQVGKVGRPRMRRRPTPKSLLPALREDLKLFPAAPNRDGSPAWMVQDPVTNRFFRIGWLEFELLARWSLRDPGLVLAEVRRGTPLEPHPDDLDAFVVFLRQHQLLRTSDAAGVGVLAQIERRARKSRWEWLLHNYLFIRLPLVRPQRFLQAITPMLGFVFTRGFLVVTVGATLLGLLLAMRQWDVFAHTFSDFLSPSGLFGYAVALFFAKTLHELAHAVTATRYGIRVAHMGIAFLVMWPMLYTDTGESWRLSDRRQRFRIAAAGMAAEFALAGFATLAWSLVDDGALRSALFFLATTSWVLTLAINASPFMRFDGYFLLSDALDLQNLHQRAFDLARTRMRRWLFGWNDPDPEPFEPGLARGLVAFAFGTWAYRLVVFVGIAVGVYFFFFKLLGIFLFAVEIVWFIARPLWSEAKVWMQRRGETPVHRRIALGVGGALLLFGLAFPWARDVRGEGWLHAEQQQLIYSPFPARLVELGAEGPVAAGQTLVVLDSPDTRSKAMQSRILADALALQLDQSVGRTEGLERRAVLAEQLGQQLAELGAQQAELQRLSLAAPFAGRLVDLDHDLKPGVWITANQPIGMLIDPSAWVVDALIEQKSLDRIRVGSPVRFHLRGATGAPFAGHVVAIDSARAQVLPHQMLATDHGGRIPATKQSNGSLVPRDALYRVRVRLDEAPAAFGQRMRMGSVLIDGERRSLLADAWTSTVSVLVRESGF